jgi:hypothetical protein
MSAVDPVAAILGGLDRPVQPRPEFAETLLSRLLEELGEVHAPARKPRQMRLRLPRILHGAPPRLRLVLIVLALLLLLAGVALATYFGVRTWVSAGPRGVQYTSDFRLAVAFRAPPRPESRTAYRSSFVLAPSGRDVYAVRYLPPWPRRRAELVRIAGVASGSRAHEERLLDYQDLAEPRLWDPGTDLGHAVIGEYMGLDDSRVQSIAVAANGDVFLIAAAWPSNKIPVHYAPPRDVSLIVRHPDGSLQKVLTSEELVRSGVLRSGGANRVALGVAASAKDRLWLRVRQPAGLFVELSDPNGDGDWADRVIRRLRLPSSFQGAWRFPQLVAEPSVQGEDRSRSILATASNNLAFRVYRVADLNDDGDASDKGELQLLFGGHRPSLEDFPEVPAIAPRTVVRDGKVVLRELVAGSFTRPTRISRISQSGEVTDFGRSFEALETVLAGRDGSVYAVAQTPGFAWKQGPRWIIYRLTPAGVNSRQAANPEGEVR